MASIGDSLIIRCEKCNKEIYRAGKKGKKIGIWYDPYYVYPNMNICDYSVDIDFSKGVEMTVGEKRLTEEYVKKSIAQKTASS